MSQNTNKSTKKGNEMKRSEEERLLKSIDDLLCSSDEEEGSLGGVEENELLKSPGRGDKTQNRSQRKASEGMRRKRRCQKARSTLEKLENMDPASITNRDKGTMKWARKVLASDPFHVPFTGLVSNIAAFRVSAPSDAEVTAGKRARSSDGGGNVAKKPRDSQPSSTKSGPSTAAGVVNSQRKSVAAPNSRGSGKPKVEVSMQPSTSSASGSTGVTRTPTMAEVARNSLSVAVIDTGSGTWRLSAERMLLVEQKLMKTLVEYLTSNTSGPIPQYDTSGWLRGTKLFVCKDQFSLDFLRSSVSRLGKMWEGASLQVVPGSDIPESPRARIWMPQPLLAAKELLTVLRSQNPTIPCEEWKVIRMDEPKPTGRNVLLQLTEESLPSLEEAKFKMHCGYNTVLVHVYRGMKTDIINSVSEGKADASETEASVSETKGIASLDDKSTDPKPQLANDPEVEVIDSVTEGMACHGDNKADAEVSAMETDPPGQDPNGSG